MSNVKLVAVFAKNELGQMARITKVLADEGINIRSFGIASGPDFGVIKFLVDDPEKALAAFKKKNFTTSLTEVVAIEMNDKSGGLAQIAEVLTRTRVNVENASGFVLEPGKRAVLIIEVADVADALNKLKGEKLHIFTEEELKHDLE